MVVRPLMRRFRIFVSSPGDVKAAREIAALTIERLAQDYARSLDIEPYLWEFEAMVASGHFQDSIPRDRCTHARNRHRVGVRGSPAGRPKDGCP